MSNPRVIDTTHFSETLSAHYRTTTTTITTYRVDDSLPDADSADDLPDDLAFYWGSVICMTVRDSNSDDVLSYKGNLDIDGKVYNFSFDESTNVIDLVLCN